MINNAIQNIKQAARGFTLIETLVAVLLLVTAIAGPLTIASKSLSAAVIARDQMVAFYLAQDAVEYVRYVRDSNRLAGTAWLTGLSNCTGASGCTIDQSTNPPTVTACPASPALCPPIKKVDDGSGHKFFSYAQGAQTPQNFIRTVIIADQGTEAVLTVSVTWKAQSGAARNVTVRENLFDWE